MVFNIKQLFSAIVLALRVLDLDGLNMVNKGQQGPGFLYNLLTTI